MTLPSYAEDFRGHPACPCQVIWLPAFEDELQRRGVITGPLPISQLIGGAPESGGTHTDGGAGDFYPLTTIADIWMFVWVARQMGADATFERPTNWDGDGGVHHVHSVLTGCPHNLPARYQIAAVAAGFNGLGHLGHGAPDTGPRPLSGRTWRQGIEWAQQQEDEMTPDQVKTLEQTAVDAAAARAAAEKSVRLAEGLRKRTLAQTTRLRTRLDRVIATGKATKADLEELRAQVDDIETAVATDEA